MNVEICFLTNACQAAFPNLTKFNQAAHLADESKGERRGGGGGREGRKCSLLFLCRRGRKQILMNLLKTLF